MTELRVADIFPVTLLATAEVVIVKFDEVFPANTVTEAGTVAAELALLSETTVSTRAAELSVTVPVLVRLPTTVDGLRVNVFSVTATGCMLSV